MKGLIHFLFVLAITPFVAYFAATHFTAFVAVIFGFAVLYGGRFS